MAPPVPGALHGFPRSLQVAPGSRWTAQPPPTPPRSSGPKGESGAAAWPPALHYSGVRQAGQAVSLVALCCLTLTLSQDTRCWCGQGLSQRPPTPPAQRSGAPSTGHLCGAAEHGGTSPPTRPTEQPEWERAPPNRGSCRQSSSGHLLPGKQGALPALPAEGLRRQTLLRTGETGVLSPPTQAQTHGAGRFQGV